MYEYENAYWDCKSLFCHQMSSDQLRFGNQMDYEKTFLPSEILGFLELEIKGLWLFLYISIYIKF